ncbi:MAG: magnesium/cobalt transporter CorA [Tychonema bourrellyi B0820]|uniref:Magnesium transport protein CorA n=2 Tax=Tychonema bourrellyi TaxID=54313 RepID=A0A2G4EWG4_9CYAN|nr:magnesium/cobalt transporter CorA [Tychonema bourrellyi]MDQ2098612.1 magnesium/cobalt transporter CorA [Tychonema bourrellyi B0820]PHX53873.1 magnesium and cobalt transport protein CorA [Tychonema bourrellyi FEM_GT703]
MIHKNLNMSSPVGQKIKNDHDDDSYVDYFYDDPGALPGNLDLEADALPPEIVLIDYCEAKATRSELANPQEAATYLDTESVSWIDMLGLGNKETWRQMGEVFNLHLIAQEDVVNVPQRPKVVDYEDHLLIIAWMVMIKPNSSNFHKEQVSFILGKHYLLTVQEEADYDCFDPVRDRIRKGQGAIRKNKADYLAYTLLDSIIDGFFPVLEIYGEQIEELEDEVVAKPTRKTLEKIYKIRRDLLTLRRAIWPQRDAINSLIRDGSDLISPEVRIYLRDCYDHTVQVMDMVETYRELSSGLMDVYLSSMGNKMNEIMKLLTVMSSIFIPLTFVAGIYGMNFNTEKSPFNMPELNWYLGYPLCLGLMGAIASGLVYFFWRRGWFENFSTVKDDRGK